MFGEKSPGMLLMVAKFYKYATIEASARLTYRGPFGLLASALASPWMKIRLASHLEIAKNFNAKLRLQTSFYASCNAFDGYIVTRAATNLLARSR